ncbi:MAG: cellulose synthase subunit BcsC-related outer membrane protein, partial [Pseudomonadota bacterium]
MTSSSKTHDDTILVERAGLVRLAPILGLAHFAVDHGMHAERVENLIGLPLKNADPSAKISALAGPILFNQILIEGLSDAPAIRLAADTARAAGDVRTAIAALESAKAIEAGRILPAASGFERSGAQEAPATAPGRANPFHTEPQTDNPFWRGEETATLGQPSASAERGLIAPTVTSFSSRNYRPAPDAPAFGAPQGEAPAAQSFGPTAPAALPPVRFDRGAGGYQATSSSSAEHLRSRLRNLGASGSVGAAAVAGANRTSDPALRSLLAPSQFDREIEDLRTEQAMSVGGGLALRWRDGEEGLSQLTEIGAPLDASFTPAAGKVTVALEPVFLSAGQFGDDPFKVRRFGALATLDETARTAPDVDDAAGVGFSVGYEVGGFNAEIGVTPTGFEVTNVVGEIEFEHKFASGLHITVGGERAAVTDSILSYAGIEDPV